MAVDRESEPVGFTAAQRQRLMELSVRADVPESVFDSAADRDRRFEELHRRLVDENLGLLQALRDFDVKGLLICESPDNEGDALLLKRSYGSL